MPHKIIINADDLGLCRSVNDAIFQVHSAGNLTSATLMVAMPGTEDAVLRSSEHPALAIGLHFCLTEGKALTGSSTLTDRSGAFFDRSTLAGLAFRGKLDPKDVRNELIAQLDRMAALGVAPDHVDSHQHIHMVPAIYKAMGPVLNERSLPVRCVDPPASAALGAIMRPKKALKQWTNKVFSNGLRRMVQGPWNEYLVSVHDLDHAGSYKAATYHGLLDRIPAGAVVELMVHPYILGDDVLEMYAGVIETKRPFLNKCLAEYEVLQGSPLFPEHELTTFACL